MTVTQPGGAAPGSEWTSETLRATLESIDSASNYADWVVSHADPYLGRRVLEVGAGVGSLTPRFLGDDPEREVHACEPDERSAEALAERHADEPRITVERCTVAELPGTELYDSAVYVNVLEHIDDDEAVLRDTARVLRSGGHLYVYSPAFPLLMSPFDRQIGHVRRYRRRDLAATARAAGFEVVSCRYYSMVGWFAWLLIARVLRRNPTGQSLAGLYDRAFVPVIRRLEARIPVPFGQSVALIARRP